MTHESSVIFIGAHMNIERIDALAHHARVTPRKLAMIDLASGREFDYQRMDERVGRLAGVLQQRFGVGHGDRVAVLSRNSTDVFEIQFACWRIGAIFVPVNWRLTVPEIEYILSDSDPRVLVVDKAFQEALEGLQARNVVPAHLARGGCDSEYERLLAQASAGEQRPVSLEESSTVI